MLSQALAMCGPTTIALLGGIIGTRLAPSPTLSTLPVSLMVVGVALSTIPAAMLMRRVGRRWGFSIGSAIAILGALLGILALSCESFPLFCVATFLVGANSAFIQQYRFGAAESVAEEYASRAISMILVGGIIAGILGPEIARRTGNLVPGIEFAGSFVVLVGLYVLVIILMQFLTPISQKVEEINGDERPLKQIIVQPKFLAAAVAGITGYGVMTFIMTATPVQMNHMLGFSLAQTTLVIQSHIVAMYLPSFFTGSLIARIGLIPVMVAGAIAMLATAVIGIAGKEFLHLWWALVLLGIGWNFLFVGGTVLLTHSYQPAERFKTQAANDFSIFSIQALASLSAGTVLFASNWDTLNTLTIPLLLLVISMLVILRIRKQI